MQSRTHFWSYFGSIKGKIILAFILGAGAIGLALGTSYLGLNKMLFVVDDLVSPNQKLNTLNYLYRQVTQLEQRQRLEAIQGPLKPDTHFLSESNAIQSTLDTLVQMPWNDTFQKNRLLEMQQILRKRDSLFIKYLQLKSNSIRNKRMTSQLDTLSDILSKSTITRDTSVRTTQRKKTTTYFKDSSVTSTAEPKRSFFNRLFSKKKQPAAPVAEPQPKVTEEVNVTIDTMAVAHRNNELKKASQMIQSLEESENVRRMSLAGRELALVRTTDLLFTQLIEILHQVEAEEATSAKKNNDDALKVFNKSMINIMIILLLFSLTAAALIYFILMDITRSNYYRQQLIVAKDQAEELGQVKDRFLTNMSHEIRTPLQSIIGFSEQMLTQPEQQRAKAIAAIHSSSQHLLHIVNEVLDYSRLESGKFKLDEKEFYLLEVVEDVTSAIEIQAKKKGLSFTIDTDAAENEYVSGDSFRLQQILYNLLGNAVKFTDAGEVKVIVQTHVDGGKVTAVFKIIDTGIGIKPEEMDKIFSRFEQANSTISGQYGGTGLGLSIVKKLVDAQHGTLEVESLPGKGSLFKVQLAFEIREERQQDVISNAYALDKAMHVLVIDDDTLILELCGLILKKENIEFTLCAHPETLYHDAIGNNVTHILMDIRMADISGIDLCQYLRKKIKPEIQIIAMSAQVPADPSSLFDSGFNNILKKPFREEDLYGVLQNKEYASADTSYESDFASLRKLTLGDEELLQSVLAEFIKETHSDLRLLETFLSNSDAEASSKIIHKLAGRMGQMGFAQPSVQLNQLEGKLLNGTPVDSLKEQIESVALILVRILEQTKHQTADNSKLAL